MCRQTPAPLTTEEVSTEEVSADTRTPDYSEMGRRSAQSRRVAAVEKRIKELVNSDLRLTDEQRDRLALLLRGSTAA